MTILEIISSRRWIGEAAHVFNLVKMLQKRGHKVILISKKGWKLSTRAKEAGFSPVELEMNGHFSIKDHTADILKLLKIIKENSIDVIHCHRGNDHWLSFMAIKLSGQKIPVVRTRHVNVPVKTHIFNRWLYKNTDSIICVASHILKGYLDSGVVPLDKLHLVYTGADISEFDFRKSGDKVRKELNIMADAPVIGIVGRIASIKGHRFLIKAAPLIKKKFPSAKFIFAGEEKSVNSTEYLRNLVKELNLEEDIIFTGYRRDIAEIAASFDVAVIASKGSEGSSRACYEYMAMKKPIVATSVGIIPELIEDGKNGFLIPPKDPDALFSAICRVIYDKSLSEKFGENAYKTLNEKFNFKKWIEKTEDILVDAVK